MPLQKKASAKHERSAAFAEVKEEVKALFTEEELLKMERFSFQIFLQNQ
jgi:hypothetical protein